MDISLASTGGAALEGYSALLPLSVLDVNDENPTFFPAIYNVSLPENVARDFKVVRLNCTDADVGLNAELSYFITGRNPLQNAAEGSFACGKAAPDHGRGVLHISAAFQTLCSIALCRRARLASCLADRFPAVPCLTQGEPLPRSIPCPLPPLQCSQEKHEDGIYTTGVAFV